MILPAPTQKSGGGEEKKSRFYQTFRNKGVLLVAGIEMSNEAQLVGAWC